MLINVCIKFREYSLSGFQVIERTRFVTDRQTDRRTDGRPKEGRHNNPYEKEMNQSTSNTNQYATNSLFDVLVK